MYSFDSGHSDGGSRRDLGVRKGWNDVGVGSVSETLRTPTGESGAYLNELLPTLRRELSVKDLVRV